jgi:hypothetical protein
MGTSQVRLVSLVAKQSSTLHDVSSHQQDDNNLL